MLCDVDKAGLDQTAPDGCVSVVAEGAADNGVGVLEGGAIAVSVGEGVAVRVAFELESARKSVVSL